MTDVAKQAKLLRRHAEHFAPRDWVFTTDDKIKHIRYEGDWSGYNHPWKRLRRAIRSAFKGRNDIFRWDLGQEGYRGLRRARAFYYHVVATFRVNLRTDRHLPDGTVNGIITHWMEDGYFLQLSQPSVISKVCDFLDAEPDNPHAQAIAAEIARVAVLRPEKEAS